MAGGLDPHTNPLSRLFFFIFSCSAMSRGNILPLFELNGSLLTRLKSYQALPDPARRKNSRLISE